MKRTLLAFAVVAGLAPALATAEGPALGVKVSTLGLGLELTQAFTPSFAARLGVNHFSYDFSDAYDGIDYDVDLALRSGSLIFDWHPLRDSFRLSLGYLRNLNNFKLRATPGSSVVIGNGTYTPAQVGTLNGRVAFKKDTPYLGFGWSSSGLRRGWSFDFDIGVVYQDVPGVQLSATGSAASSPAFQSDLRREEQNIKDDIEDYRYYPVISMGVSYHF